MEPLPAIVTAGEGRASQAVYGQPKVHLEVAGRPLVAHVVAVLQRVPEVSEVWVVGNAERLEQTFSDPAFREQLRKPLTIVPEFRNLYENGWETYRRALPGAGPAGRELTPEDAERPALFLSGDLPLATPQEISSFIQRGLASGRDYALGLVDDAALEPFRPTPDGKPGIRLAYFNLREGRFRQSNLHLIRPAKITKRHLVEEMYENRHQKRVRDIIGLAWKLMIRDGGGLVVLYYYGLMHLAGVLDRHGWRRLADRLRSLIPMPRVEKGVSRILGGSFGFVLTDEGGCAVDVDTEEELDAVRARFEEWQKSQAALAERLHGPLPLPERAGAPAPLRVLHPEPAVQDREREAG